MTAHCFSDCVLFFFGGDNMYLPDLKQDFRKYVFLNMIGSFGISLYILADTFFIAKGLGTEGLAALNLALPVFNFLNGFGLMFGIGGATKFSIFYCHTDRIETDRIFTNTILGMLNIALIFEILGIFFSKQITVLLGADEHVFELTHEYLRMILLFSPAFLLNQVMICFVRNDSAPKLATAAMLVSSAVNVILDCDFIFIRQMGMKGAALATCLSPLFSIAVMSLHIASGWNAFQFRFQKPSFRMIREIVSLGFSSFVTELAAGIVMIVFNILILKLEGNTGVAAYGIVANIAIVIVSLYTGISYGIQPLMSREHGAHDKKALKYLLTESLKLSGVLSVVIYISVFFTSSGIAGIFNSEKNPELQQMAEDGLWLYFTAIPFMGMNIINTVFFTSLEKPKPAQLLSMLRGIILVLPIAVIFSNLWDITGIWLTVPAAEFLTCITGIVIYLIKIRPEIIEKPKDPFEAYYD